MGILESINEIAYGKKIVTEEDKKLLKDIVKEMGERTNQFINQKYPEKICSNCNHYLNGYCLEEGEDKKILRKPQDFCAVWDNKQNKENKQLKEAYFNVRDILKYYLDWNEDFYTIVSLWIVGTYFHKEFPTYPYLFLNATKSGGKTRGLNIITTLSDNGSLLNSLTEAVLFRTTGTLGIDEFEGIERKGKEALRELLNSAYKRGTKVKRMRKVKTMEGEQQVVEEFDIYRPLVLANISGMENVLNDRCIPLIIEKSFDPKFTHLIEIFKENATVKKTIELLKKCRKCRCIVCGETIKIYEEWNNFIKNTYTNYTHYTNYTNYTNYTQRLISLNLGTLGGRPLELCFPLILIAGEISEELQKETTLILKKVFEGKKEDDFEGNSDISLIDFISQEPEESERYFIAISELTHKFKSFMQSNEEWLNNIWMGRALQRLSLIKEKRRRNRGIEIRLNIKKAQDKIKMFK